MRCGLFLSFISSVILVLSFLKMFSRINCFSSSIKEIRSSHMNPRCKLRSQLISTTNPLNPWLEQFQQWSCTIFQNRLWVKILQKFYLFVSSVKFSIHLCGNTARKCDTPQDFFPFSFRFIFFQLVKVIFGAFLLKQLFYSGLNHNPISYISQTKQQQKIVKWICATHLQAKDARGIRASWLIDSRIFRARPCSKNSHTCTRDGTHLNTRYRLLLMYFGFMSELLLLKLRIIEGRQNLHQINYSKNAAWLIANETTV